MNGQSRQDFPLYAKGILAYLAHDSNKFHVLRNSQSLSLAEKTLLNARALFRERNWNEGLQQLQRAGSFGPPFLEAERLFLMARAAFQLGHIEDSALFNQSALHGYGKAQDRRGEFITLYNLSVDYSRLGLMKISDSYLEAAKAKAETVQENALIYRALACSCSNEGRFDAACQWLEKALALKERLERTDRNGLLAVAADIFFRAGKVGETHRALEAADRDPRLNQLHARTEFELKVLSALLAKAPLKTMPPALKKNPEYALKWRILSAIQEGEPDRASQAWQELCVIFPQVFGPGFSCKVESETKGIFFSYLMHLKNKSALPNPPNQIKATSRLGHLFLILSKAPYPLRKEKLIEKLWRVPYDPKLDSRFFKLVERLKKVSGVSVQCINRAYSLSGGVSE